MYSSSQGCHTAKGTHMPHGITQCYLPPGRRDIPKTRAMVSKAESEAKRHYWHCLCVRSGVYETVGLSVCLSVRSSHRSLRRVCCCGPGGQDISIGCCTAGGSGVVLKRNGGTPETRLSQRFLNNLGLHTRTLIHARKIATADLWSCPAIQLLVFECL